MVELWSSFATKPLSNVQRLCTSAATMQGHIDLLATGSLCVPQAVFVLVEQHIHLSINYNFLSTVLLFQHLLLGKFISLCNAGPHSLAQLLPCGEFKFAAYYPELMPLWREMPVEGNADLSKLSQRR